MLHGYQGLGAPQSYQPEICPCVQETICWFSHIWLLSIHLVLMVAQQNISLCEYWRKTTTTKNNSFVQFPHSHSNFFLPSCAVCSLIPIFMCCSCGSPSPLLLSPDALVPCSEICREMYSFPGVLFIALAYSVLCFINSPPCYTNGFPQGKIRCTSTAWSLEQQRSLPSPLYGLRHFPCAQLCIPMDSCINEANQHLQPALSFGSLYQCPEIVAL